MNKFIEQDATDYGRWASGWRLGLLVARSVKKGTGAHRVANATGEKVSAREFGEKAGTSADRVLRHLGAWQAAAADGHVPDAATLEPGQDVDLSSKKLPDWSNYYPPVTGGRTTSPGTKTQVEKAIEAATPEAIAEALEGASTETVEKVAQATAANARTRIATGKAINKVYKKQTKKTVKAKKEKEVERHGSEAEQAEFVRLEEIAEMRNVARGMITSARYVTTRALALDPPADVREELAEIATTVVDYMSMLKSYAEGDTITDEALHELIGEEN